MYRLFVVRKDNSGCFGRYAPFGSTGWPNCSGGSFSGFRPGVQMTSKIPPRHGSHGTPHASLAKEERQHNMPTLAKRIERGEGVALETGAPSPAQMMAVLSHRLPYLYRCAYRLLGNKADAEDAVQDALLAAFKHLNQFRGEAQLSTWGDHDCYQLRKNAFAQELTVCPCIPGFANRRRAGVSSVRHFDGSPP